MKAFYIVAFFFSVRPDEEGEGEDVALRGRKRLDCRSGRGGAGLEWAEVGLDYAGLGVGLVG